MSDVGPEARPGDPDRINLAEDHDVRRWARTFGVTEVGLRTAVARVGDDAEAVRRELGGQGRGGGLNHADL